ncbi:hypothetical protein ISN44_As13g007460 [Arabidopsis suecica]|uniref:Uncharacterized protein n=1 Tax=Arabidopsis suecica TaxID=45249 RepID=A0A8T1XQ47_ARASU|nr:hypothetical protein ISN44_As13g007460 [Arabidopsis suecica]
MNYKSATVLRLSTTINNKQQHNKKSRRERSCATTHALEARPPPPSVSCLAVRQHFTGMFSKSFLTNSLRFGVNASSLQATVFIGEEGWRMADTCHASGDTWRSAPNPRHIARDKWRRT